MSIFHASDIYEVIESMSAVACWAFGARFGWWLAGRGGMALRDLFRFLRQLFRRPRY